MAARKTGVPNPPFDSRAKAKAYFKIMRNYERAEAFSRILDGKRITGAFLQIPKTSYEFLEALEQEINRWSDDS